MTNGVSLETVTDRLKEVIKDKDLGKTLLMTMQLKEMVRTDPVAVKWVADPANLKELHTLLTEYLDVPPKMMMIRNRVPHRQKRAYLFMQAIENGIRKVISE